MIKNILSSFMDGSPKELFKTWHFLFERSYTLDTQEAKDRYANFKKNLLYIKTHNAQDSPYKLGLNQFSDMTLEEYKTNLGSRMVIKGAELDELLKSSQNLKPVNFLKNDDDDDDLTKRNLSGYAPIDYRPFYNPVRQQGTCGSCWAFSTAAAIEGNVSKKTGKVLPYLSTQQFLDCNTRGQQGCKGGNYVNSFPYAIQEGNTFERTYPYIGYQSNCNYYSNTGTRYINNYVYCSSYSYNVQQHCSIATVYNMLQRGPISVGIDANTNDFMNYRNGVFTAKCYADNHAVVVVGYGRDNATGWDYWLVRNSHGLTWGENGYIRVAINDVNNRSCFVNNEAYLPVV